ncbi:MAG: chromate resistance protein [Candidatus Nitricoxidivorans perseverans]|uniref:Chromate resistance protein n=1 Tax=Candidatus Nitricoxidivorans perseverans TaxID=2975601 RepID=A0AA49FM23_9PROT|nr:MAG: chromate resistance protein [Candidatus Nitricoxidivorans perseverans]
MNDSTQWRLLVASLPTKPAAARMRLWRGVKAAGCAALRDGAWLLPASGARTLARLAENVVAAGGSAEVLTVVTEAEQTTRFAALFDRDGEPRAGTGEIRRLAAADFQGRTWATRKNLWIDRMASAWLISRFIDRKAKFLWIDSPKKCPKSALGFDFDGAAFTHVGSRVTFEVLMASFGLDTDPALAKIGAIVHCLDVGGVSVPEAAGVEAVLGGLRAAAPDDDRLLTESRRVFDGLYDNFRKVNDDA